MFVRQISKGLDKAFDPAFAHHVESMKSNEASGPTDTSAITISCAAAKFTPTPVTTPNSDIGEAKSAAEGGDRRWRVSPF